MTHEESIFLIKNASEQGEYTDWENSRWLGMVGSLCYGIIVISKKEEI